MEGARISCASTVLIHSAFKEFSKNNVDPSIFTKEIVSYFDDSGTVLMPAMSWKICTPLNPYFDVRSTPGNVGILAEIFRKNYAKFRSIHPTHSVCGKGPKAKDILCNHSEEDTPCSELSPFRRLASVNGIVLMMGVDLSACTLFHCAEEMCAQNIYLEDDPQEFICFNENGQKQTVLVKRHKRIPRYFNKLKPFLEASGALRCGLFRGVEWTSIDARKSLLIALDILRTDPYSFLKNI